VFSEVRYPLAVLKVVLCLWPSGVFTSSMHLATAYIHPTLKGGSCRVRVYVPEEEEDAPVVLCSEMPTNPGLSLTRATELVAGEIISVIRVYVGANGA
jgi:hypothetical protein